MDRRDFIKTCAAGAADSFLSRNKANTWDAKLAKATKWVAIAFMVLTLVLSLLPAAAAAPAA